MGIGVSKTINLISADVYIGGKLVPAADLERLTVERDTNQADACHVVLAKSYPDAVLRDTLEVRARLEDEGAGDPKTLFSGKVFNSEPYYNSKDGITRTKIVAFDHLSGVRLNDVPSPIEIIAYIGQGKQEYITRVLHFLGSQGSQEELNKVMAAPNVGAVLDAIPGGHSANRDKFTAKLKELVQLDQTARRNLLGQMRVRAQEGPFPAIGGYSFVYFYPPQPNGTTVLVIDNYVIKIDQ